MDIRYRMEDDLDWNDAERIDVHPKGWKGVTISFIDSYPFVFWRINSIEKNFRSNSDVIARRGANEFFSESLASLKLLVEHTLDSMPEERKRFYKENILELFDE